MSKSFHIVQTLYIISLGFISQQLNAAEIGYAIDSSAGMAYASEAKELHEEEAKSEHEYKPLLEEGKAWWYNYKVVKNLAGEDVHDMNLMLKLEGTKKIDGKEWHALNLYCDGVCDATVAYLHEDMDSRQVYIKAEDFDRYVICNNWFAEGDGILYDFNNPDMNILSYFNESKVPVEVEANGESYRGWMIDDELLPIAAVESLGLIPYSDDANNGFVHVLTPTLLGFVDQLTGGTLNIYPYLYKITDKEDNVLYEIKENEFSSNIAPDIEKFSARVEGRTIRIDNPLAQQVTMTDTAGIILYRSSETSISIEASPGIYVVTIADKATKLIVK